MSQHILLTGGNGFIAVHIIVILLEHGYIVTTTLRSEGKAAYLRKMFAAAVNEGQLRFAIVEDITVLGAFDQVVKDNKFDGVLHTSSPVAFNVVDVVKDLLIPAIDGTTGILKSIKAYGPTVKRVVLTASFAAMNDREKGDRPGYVYSEKDWNPITEEEAKQVPGAGYRASKKLAEKAAWDFVENEQPSFDLVTICPPMVYGPALQEVTDLQQLNYSSTAFYTLFSGKDQGPKQVPLWLWVDVRDVAWAHLAAIETPRAGNNRFLISGGTFNIAQVCDFIWKAYPERARTKGIPKSKPEDHGPPGGTYSSNNSKSKEILGVEYRNFWTTLKDMLDQFIALEVELGIE
ncbi:NADPH-dependent methylglyoxal reductase GRE2 protein [Ceratobasidium sp. AG-Ba]|nr:NADPH-dependent methylglyoxal reductase GRE2 protein [Ceratobasidium sp. AG-Ba]